MTRAGKAEASDPELLVMIGCTRQPLPVRWGVGWHLHRVDAGAAHGHGLQNGQEGQE